MKTPTKPNANKQSNIKTPLSKSSSNKISKEKITPKKKIEDDEDEDEESYEGEDSSEEESESSSESSSSSSSEGEGSSSGKCVFFSLLITQQSWIEHSCRFIWLTWSTLLN